MSSPRKTGQGDIILSAKRRKSLKIDGQTIQGKCPDMKIVGMMNLRKMKVLLRKLHHQQTHQSICKEEESKKDEPQKESPQSKKVWKKK
jgi:hypothetical protein